MGFWEGQEHELSEFQQTMGKWPQLCFSLDHPLLAVRVYFP